MLFFTNSIKFETKAFEASSIAASFSILSVLISSSLDGSICPSELGRFISAPAKDTTLGTSNGNGPRRWATHWPQGKAQLHFSCYEDQKPWWHHWLFFFSFSLNQWHVAAAIPSQFIQNSSSRHSSSALITHHVYSKPLISYLDKCDILLTSFSVSPSPYSPAYTSACVTFSRCKGMSFLCSKPFEPSLYDVEYNPMSLPWLAGKYRFPGTCCHHSPISSDTLTDSFCSSDDLLLPKRQQKSSLKTSARDWSLYSELFPNCPCGRLSYYRKVTFSQKLSVTPSLKEPPQPLLSLSHGLISSLAVITS